MNLMGINHLKIPKDWKWVKLDTLCTKISLNKIKIKQKEYLTEGKYPVVDQGQELIGGYYNDDRLIVPDEPPYIVFGDHTKVKKFISFKFIPGADGVKVLKPKEIVEPKFLYYSLFTIRVEDKGYARHFQFLEKELFPLPPLPIQQAIVSKIEELFSELDNGIAQLKTAQQQLKTYRQSVLKWAFEGKLTNKMSESGFAGLKDERMKKDKNKKIQQSSNLENPDSDNKQPAEREGFAPPDLPAGWKWVKLGEVCDSVEYGSAAKSKETGKIPVLRMGNIQNGRFVWDDLVYTDDEIEIKKYLLKKDDVLFNRTNSAELVGKTAIYKGERPAIFAGYLIRINRIESLLNADYLTYYLNTHAARQYGNTVRSFGVNQSNINGTKLKSYPLPLPSLEEQHQIVQEIESRLSVADKLEESISASLQQAEALRQSILKKAFEGRLVI